jgi:hypothetical protein
VYSWSSCLVSMDFSRLPSSTSPHIFCPLPIFYHFLTPEDSIQS